MGVAPVTKTDRLLLREPALKDWPGFAEVMTSDRAKYTGGPFSLENAWGSFCHGIAEWQLFGVGNLSIELRETGNCIGQIEINQGSLFPEPELGWQLLAGAEGNGFAFEAAVAMRDWAFRERKLKTLLRCIDPNNSRSVRLAGDWVPRSTSMPPSRTLKISSFGMSREVNSGFFPTSSDARHR